MNDKVTAIDRCLPQTQCTQCSYPGCLEYAEAIATGQADINQCPPGGETTIKALAKLLNLKPKALNQEFGEHRPRTVAKIIEDQCIGCTLCIKACPVDAILGSNKLMHSIIESECTGCELCLPPCPMDCIVMPEIEHSTDLQPWPQYSQAGADVARARRQTRLQRLDQGKKNTQTPSRDKVDRKSMILSSIKRSQAKRNEQ